MQNTKVQITKHYYTTAINHCCYQNFNTNVSIFKRMCWNSFWMQFSSKSPVKSAGQILYVGEVSNLMSEVFVTHPVFKCFSQLVPSQVFCANSWPSDVVGSWIIKFQLFNSIICTKKVFIVQNKHCGQSCVKMLDHV